MEEVDLLYLILVSILGIESTYAMIFYFSEIGGKTLLFFKKKKGMEKVWPLASGLECALLNFSYSSIYFFIFLLCFL